MPQRLLGSLEATLQALPSDTRSQQFAQALPMVHRLPTFLTLLHHTRDITLAAGQRITYGTCNVTGASGTGDTYLRLYTASGTQVSSNDDSSGCGTLSYATYTVPAGAGGT